MSDHPTLFVRTDGGAHIGLGHVTRCVALARAWRARGGSVTFLTADSPTELRTALQAEGFAVESLSVVPGHGDDAEATVAADRGSRRVMLVDGYRFDAAFRRRVRAGVDRLIVIDDALEPVDYDADVVINPNLYARGPARRDRVPHQLVLAGPRYALLRPEFGRWRTITAEAPIARRATSILISMGGSDPENATPSVVALLDDALSPDITLTVLIGPTNARAEALMSQFDGRPRVELVRDPPDVAAQLAASDLAVVGAGTICLELATLGRPMVATSLSPDQVAVARGVAEHEIGLDVGPWPDPASQGVVEACLDLIDDAARRAAMADRGRSLVDGSGADRVVDAVWDPPSRRARHDD